MSNNNKPNKQKVSDLVDLTSLEDMSKEEKTEFLDKELGRSADDIRESMNIVYNSAKSIENMYDGTKSENMSIDMRMISQGALASISLTLQIYNFISTIALNAGIRDNNRDSHTPEYGKILQEALTHTIQAIKDVEKETIRIFKEKGIK